MQTCDNILYNCGVSYYTAGDSPFYFYYKTYDGSTNSPLQLWVPSDPPPPPYHPETAIPSNPPSIVTPEPSSFAMILGAFAILALLFALRRKD